MLASQNCTGAGEAQPCVVIVDFPAERIDSDVARMERSDIRGKFALNPGYARCGPQIGLRRGRERTAAAQEILDKYFARTSALFSPLMCGLSLKCLAIFGRNILYL
jgi:hypothetical protein